jgi:KaiC/GvpD/RAD55 family RecA-like ATPase
MRHPVFGSGVDTPLGKSNPSMAAEAARHVRKAISHLIPRDKIANELLGSVGVQLASFLGPAWGLWYNKDLKPDSYDNNTAAAELRAAGYTVGGISTLNPTQQGPSFWLIGGGVIAIVVLTSSTLVVKRKRRRMRSAAASQMVSTGFDDLQGLLHGGIPVGYSVLMISPPSDESDLLLRRMLKANLASGMQAALVSGDLGKTQDLVGKFPKDFLAFCPEAHRVSSGGQNLYEIPGVGNLVEFNIVLNKGLSEHVIEGKPRVIIMDLLSDLLLRHKAIMTRKWLTEFIAKRKAQHFTTICTLNPAMASKEETGRITDLFDGIIEIYEKESEGRPKRFLAIRKMYGQDYSESELLLERSKLL